MTSTAFTKRAVGCLINLDHLLKNAETFSSIKVDTGEPSGIHQSEKVQSTTAGRLLLVLECHEGQFASTTTTCRLDHIDHALCRAAMFSVVKSNDRATVLFFCSESEQPSAPSRNSNDGEKWQLFFFKSRSEHLNILATRDRDRCFFRTVPPEPHRQLENIKLLNNFLHLPYRKSSNTPFQHQPRHIQPSGHRDRDPCSSSSSNRASSA